VHQARLSVHADVRLHPEVPLLALLALVHLRVALAAGLFLVELGAAISVASTTVPARSSKPLRCQQLVDGGQDLRGQLVLLQQVAKAQDGALVRQPISPAAQAREVAEQRHVVQRFFHGRVAQR
jgi:hypothetical protein